MQGFFKCFGIGTTNSSFRKKSNQLQRSQVLDHDHHEPNNINKVLPESDNSPTCSSTIIVRKFSWEEIERFTNNFCSSRVIGYGGFSTVYLANQDHHGCQGMAAIKIINGSRFFKQELDILRRLHHRNIVGLIGYFDDRDDQGALVLEYISNGSLEEKLHGEVGRETCASISVLPWKNRMEIAQQVAEALEYLHEKCGGLPIIHGDIKASNVLLDQHLNCKLCDFGSASVGFSSAVKPNRALMMGSPGYTDPHYLRTGIPSKKNDVYSFGVLLLELVTGMQAFCSESNRPLASRVGPMLGGDDMDVAVLVDPRLSGEFDAEEARAMLSLSAQCLRQPPTLRPSASQILQTLNDNISCLAPPAIPYSYHGSKNLRPLQK